MSKTDIYNNIPSEIWCKITQQLSQKDLFECQKVCKSWYLSTCLYFWENVELKTIDHVDLFLNGCSKDAKNFVKSIVIGDQHAFYDPPLKLILSKEQTKGLLFNLPNLKKVLITLSFGKSIISELKKDEFLTEFRKSCPNIQSFKAFETLCYHHQNYSKILYSLRNTIIDLVITKTEQKIYQQITAFSKLKHLTLHWTSGTFLEFLYKIKMLPRLKYLYFANFYFGDNDESNIELIDIEDTLKIIEEDQTLKERLASLKKLHLKFDDPTRDYLYYTSIIKQYFIGLNEIHVNLAINNLISEWMDFIFSHEEYKLETECIFSHDMSIHHYIDNIAICLKNNFIQNTTDNKKVTKHLWLALDCSAYNKLDPDTYQEFFQFGRDFSLLFESEKIDNNHFLKFARIYLIDSENTLNSIYETLNSEKYIIEDINTLTFEFTDEEVRRYNTLDPEEMCLVNYNTLRSIDQILSLATDKLKKVIIKSENCCKWSKYFVKYEKVNTYRQVTHLEVYVRANNGELLDDLTLPQLTVVFPCINYLTLEYSYDTYRDCVPNNTEMFINLPHSNLKKLTLDASILKLMAQEAIKTQNDFSDTYFILKVEANQKLYNYQISLDFLNVTELEENDKELDMKKSLQVYIILNNIECLELYLTYSIFMGDKALKKSYFDIHFPDKDYTKKEKALEHRIYFE